MTLTTYVKIIQIGGGSPILNNYRVIIFVNFENLKLFCTIVTFIITHIWLNMSN